MANLASCGGCSSPERSGNSSHHPMPTGARLTTSSPDKDSLWDDLSITVFPCGEDGLVSINTSRFRILLCLLCLLAGGDAFRSEVNATHDTKDSVVCFLVTYLRANRSPVERLKRPAIRHHIPFGLSLCFSLSLSHTSFLYLNLSNHVRGIN